MQVVQMAVRLIGWNSVALLAELRSLVMRQVDRMTWAGCQRIQTRPNPCRRLVDLPLADHQRVDLLEIDLVVTEPAQVEDPNSTEVQAGSRLELPAGCHIWGTSPFGPRVNPRQQNSVRIGMKRR